MAARLSRRCSRTHVHEPLLAGKAKAAEDYSDQLILEILRGMRDTEDALADKESPSSCGEIPGAESQSVAMVHDVTSSLAFSVAQQDMSQNSSSKTTSLMMKDGSIQPVNLAEHLKEKYRDEYTDELLPKRVGC